MNNPTSRTTSGRHAWFTGRTPRPVIIGRASGRRDRTLPTTPGARRHLGHAPGRRAGATRSPAARTHHGRRPGVVPRRAGCSGARGRCGRGHARAGRLPGGPPARGSPPVCSAWSRSPPRTGSASRPSPGDRRPAAAARDARRGGVTRPRPRTGHPTGRTRPRERLRLHLGKRGRRAARALGGCDRLGAQPRGSGFPVSSSVLSALRISVDPPDTCSSVGVPAGIPECSIVTRVNASPIGSIRNS